MKKVALIMHNGVEESEAVVTIDLLRRAGIQVDLYTVQEKEISTAHGLKIRAEKNINELKVTDYDGLVYPGGPGVEQLLEIEEIPVLAQQFFATDKLVAAICAAPQILGKAGLLQGIKVTHFPGANKFMDGAIEDLTQPVIVEKNIITSKGVGTAIRFALTIVEYLLGLETRKKLANQIVYSE